MEGEKTLLVADNEIEDAGGKMKNRVNCQAKKMHINPLKVRGSLNYAISEVRRALLIAADDSCQKCGKGLGKFHVHHLDGCPLNWSKENLLVVCPSCHTKIQGYIKKQFKPWANALPLGRVELPHAYIPEKLIKRL